MVTPTASPPAAVAPVKKVAFNNWRLKFPAWKIRYRRWNLRMSGSITGWQTRPEWWKFTGMKIEGGQTTSTRRTGKMRDFARTWVDTVRRRRRRRRRKRWWTIPIMSRYDADLFIQQQQQQILFRLFQIISFFYTRLKIHVIRCIELNIKTNLKKRLQFFSLYLYPCSNPTNI